MQWNAKFWTGKNSFLAAQALKSYHFAMTDREHTQESRQASSRGSHQYNKWNTRVKTCQRGSFKQTCAKHYLQSFSSDGLKPFHSSYCRHSLPSSNYAKQGLINSATPDLQCIYLAQRPTAVPYTPSEINFFQWKGSLQKHSVFYSVFPDIDDFSCWCLDSSVTSDIINECP